MRRASLAAASLAVLALAGAAASAQEPAPVYQQQKKQAFRFAGDTLARYEWTENIPVPGTDLAPGEPAFVDESRSFLQARPRLELTIGPVELGAGGAFNYSDKINDETPEGFDEPLLIRDNFRSRDVRLDLAYGKVTFGPVSAVGGRFLMPLPFTEMIWDRDLRPQGGAVTLAFPFGGSNSTSRFALYGIYATGSHVYEDKSVMYGGAAELNLGAGGGSGLQLVGSYLQFKDLDKLQLAIRRQNTRELGQIVGEYHVVDLLARLTRGGQVPLQLVFDYCWNTQVSDGNHGLWLAMVIGSTDVSRAQLAYTFAKVDKDATVAAFNTDDFFWGTGWEAHRADLGVATRKNNSLHAIAQWQRFKDSPDPATRDLWVTRYRLEWRTNF
jgi:hypothetical protein